MRLTDTIISLHPAIVTCAFLIFFVGGAFAVNAGFLSGLPFVFSATMLLLLAPMILWHYSLYRAATDRSISISGHRGRRAFLFLFAALGTGSYLILFPVFVLSTNDVHSAFGASLTATAMVVGNLAYFASIWAAGNALTRFDEQTKSTEFHKTLGTFILEFYLPVGVWVIYPRIRRLLAAPIQT